MGTAASKKVVSIKKPEAPTNEALVKLSQNFAIELRPFPDAEAAVAFKHEAAGIIVSDAGTHKAALEALRRGKALSRGIEEHWRHVLRWLEDRKKDVRAIMDTDMELVAPGLATLTNTTLFYENAEKERVRVETERRRIDEERRANARRQQELADLEEKAQAAEAASEDLSERERVFVNRVAALLGPSIEPANIPVVEANTAARAAGFKQENFGAVLMARPKIVNAIESVRQAAAIREQASAVAEKPVEVTKVEVESHTAKVAGVRTVVTWTGECLDVNALIDAVLQGTAERRLLMPNQVEINQMARSLHENLDRIPGLRHVRKETKAG